MCMLIFISIMVGILVLKRFGVYNKKIGNTALVVNRVVDAAIYLFMFVVFPLAAIVLLLALEGKPLYNRLRKR